MKAIEFKEQNVVFAKDQKEYSPLPAHGQQNGVVTFCMQLDAREVKKIRESHTLRLTVLNFNRPVQPIKIWTTNPEFPIPFDIDLNANPETWDKEKGLATFRFDLDTADVAGIKKYKKLWITTVTYGAPLQPINTILK